MTHPDGEHLADEAAPIDHRLTDAAAVIVAMGEEKTELVRLLEQARNWAGHLEGELAELVAAVGEIHRPRTFETRSDYHHAESVAAMGAVAPCRHDCTAECFEWVTICDGDGTSWPCSTASSVAALTGGEQA